MRTKWGAPEKGWPMFDANGRRIRRSRTTAPTRITAPVSDVHWHEESDADCCDVYFEDGSVVRITWHDIAVLGLGYDDITDERVTTIARTKGIR